MSHKVLHQFSEGAAPGDAITAQMLSIRQWLRDLGYCSEIYAASVHPALQTEVRDALRFRPKPEENRAIYHHSIGSAVADHLCELQTQLLLIYHNITPPEFFRTSDPGLAAQLQRGIDQLARLRAQTSLALGVSNYNRIALETAGFAQTGVLPLPLDEAEYDYADDPTVLKQIDDHRPLLLYVGRLTPNKRQEDLIKLLLMLRRIIPTAGLALVGSPWSPPYVRWLHDLVRSLDLQGAVVFAGHVPQQTMVTYYRHADLYVSMSEHEGFGKPLIESMYFGLPVMAFASTGVPETLGGAGVLFHDKHFEALAEVAGMLLQDRALRERIIERQHQRVKVFLAQSVQAQWRCYLEQFWKGSSSA